VDLKFTNFSLEIRCVWQELRVQRSGDNVDIEMSN